MKLTLTRYGHGSESTLGVLMQGRYLHGYTLEDTKRDVKIAGETCIPEGTYKIDYRKVLSKMTGKYREKYDWFQWHLQLQQVENFSNVYIHVGNNRKSTDGCILLGSTSNNNMLKDGFIGASKDAFKPFYEIVGNALKSNEIVELEVRSL